MWAILMIGQCFSRASHRCFSYYLSSGSFDMVDLHLWDALSRWRTPREFLLLLCECHFFWTGHINSCMFMINYWSLHNQVACYPCLVWVLDHWCFGRSWWLYSDLQGHSSTVDHCQTFNVLIIRLAKNLFLREKCFTDTGYGCTSFVASKRAVI